MYFLVVSYLNFKTVFVLKVDDVSCRRNLKCNVELPADEEKEKNS